MVKKSTAIRCFFYIKSIVFCLSILTSQVNAETEIIAKDGDTLIKLSKQYGIPLKDLMHKNNFNDANRILKGKAIIIPQNNNVSNNMNNTYKVKEGDTLYKIAREYNVDLKDIISINNLGNSSFLKPNQIIILPKGVLKKRLTNQKNIKLASKKVFYHQTTKAEEIKDIADIHEVSIEEIITLNKLNNTNIINANINLRVREVDDLKWLKYGSLIINWSDWRYLDGFYITQAKNKKNKPFYLAISCKKRILNNTLKNSSWTNWYFPANDFEFKLINDFCEQDF